MKTNILLSVLALFLMPASFGQKATFDFTFTAIDSLAHIHLDSIKVMNRTQGNSTVLFWPDTTLTLEINQGDLLLFIGYATEYPVGIKENHPGTEEFTLYQSYPNPVRDQGMVSLYIPEQGTLNLLVTDLQGRVIISADWQLDKGYHMFNFIPGDGRLFLLTARWNGISRNNKILTMGNISDKRWSLDYAGSGKAVPLLKASSLNAGILEQSGILDAPESNKTYTFQFATNIPCPGTPVVTYEGQIYNTIQIFSQCWIKENMNVGTMVPGTQEMTDNGIIEKYCHSNEADSCTTYGGLYQWNEMMQYDTLQGSQGICPPGWHLPTDEEWKVLEGSVDSQVGIGNGLWDLSGLRGFDAGKNLKTTSGWKNNGNGTDLFGFSAMPGSYRILSGTFDLTGNEGVWWTSSEAGSTKAWYVNMHFFSPKIGKWDDSWSVREYGFSARCIRDL
jgi:uncharacterized protein (TIGR02145 family)